MKDRAFCVHGHFYQPPREDPLTGLIPLEPGAAPYSNWNEKIVDDCYRPNAEEGNFNSLSFNLGPTLSAWLAQNHPAIVHRAAMDDRYNEDLHQAGNAMAQTYHHTILPLATREDKITQVHWGIDSFRSTFFRHPKGMWLPETAVDLETLEILAQNGIEFTILAPWQVEGDIDPRRPYKVNLPAGRTITVFCYDQELSSNISFNASITANADEFTHNSLSGKFTSDGGDQLVLVASDGELYGHHQKFRYKFLKQLFKSSLQKAGIRSVYPELWLKEHPATDFAQIRELTSWSCMHELKRWCGACACTPHPGWKEPLRAALNRTAEAIDGLLMELLRDQVPDPQEIRDLAIKVRDPQFDLRTTLAALGMPNLTTDAENRLNLLLHAQFERQRMFASCAWFFEDFDRIEPQNAVRYAANAVHLARKATSIDLASDLIPYFRKVRSGRADIDGGTIFTDFLERAVLY